MSERILVKEIDKIPFLSTSHNIGKKKIILFKLETKSNISQIALYI
jgi:hypothetical protein